MRCKHCKEKFEPIHFNQKYCIDKDECRREMNIAASKKKKAAYNKENKSLPQLMKETQIVFNSYIRKRDYKNGCISCGKLFGDEKYDAGHYISTRHKIITFDEDNVHAQCVACNQHKNSNHIPYRKNLLEKIGEERVNRLEEIYVQTKKWTKYELKELTDIYKKKLKEL